MRALIVGLGSIGRRHLKNLRRMEPEAIITVCRQNKINREKQEVPEADRVVYDLDEALKDKPDLALICSPAPYHVDAGLALARENVNLFIEKPVSHALEGVDDLIVECRGRGVVLAVGYNFRFDGRLQIMRQALLEGRIGRILAVRAEVGSYLPDWRPGRDYKESVSARRDLGGGVVLELSHELDYVRWLVGEVTAVSARTARLSDLGIDVEDTAEIILEFNQGAIGSVHLDMVQRTPTRICRVVGSDGVLIWDGINHSVRLFSAASKTWSDLHKAESIDRNEMYEKELRHFLDCVAGRSMPIVSGEDSRRVLEIALAVKRSSQEQKVVAI